MQQYVFFSGIILIFDCQELDALKQTQQEVRNFVYLFMQHSFIEEMPIIVENVSVDEGSNMHTSIEQETEGIMHVGEGTPVNQMCL